MATTNNSHVEESLPVNAMPLISVEPEPNPFTQAVPEHTSGPVVVVERARVKLSRRSDTTFPKGNALPLAYILKVPTQEALFQIYNYYTVIKELVFTFDRQHEESWFEAYPMAVLLPEGTKSRPSRDELRSNYRYYASALAHYAYYYAATHRMKTASLVNLLNICRFQGKTKNKDVATLTRINLINRASADIQNYPQPTGSVNQIASQAKYAIGSTANGVTALAMPLYDVSVYGNLGNHAGSLKDGIVDIKPDVNSPDQGAAYAFSESPEYQEFLLNSARIASDYYAAKSFDILNASTLVIKGGGEAENDAYISLQRDGRTRIYDSDPQRATSLTQLAWSNYEFWSSVLANQYPEMRDPANDIRRLFKDLHFVEDMPDTQMLTNLVHQQPFYDITSLRNAMRYMKDGKANTATIIRQNLPIINAELRVDGNPDSDIDVTTYEKGIRSAEVFDVNFHRFHLEEDTAVEWIKQAKAWPGLTPRAFPDSVSGGPDNQAALIAGAISSDGSVTPVAEGFMNAGKYATFFDYATHQTLDPSKSSVEMSGVSEEYATKIVENREGFICNEDPSQVFVRYSDLIDVSDPFQCGFYLLNVTPDSAKSEWEQFLSEQQSFPGAGQDPEFTRTSGPDKAAPFTTLLDGVPIAISRVNPGKVLNSLTCFFTTDWYSLLFLGSMPFVLPQARTILNSLALPVEYSRQFDAQQQEGTSALGAAKAKYNALLRIAATEYLLEQTKDPTSGVSTALANSLPVSQYLADEADEGEKEGRTITYKSEGGEGTNIVPNGAKFFLTPLAKKSIKGAIVDFVSPGNLPFGAASVDFVANAWTNKDGLSRIGGLLQYYSADGTLIRSVNGVSFLIESATSKFKGNASASPAPDLTYNQILALQQASINDDGTGAYQTSWIKPNNWDLIVKDSAKSASIWATFYQTITPESTEIDESGLKLGFQVPLATVAAQPEIPSAITDLLTGAEDVDEEVPAVFDNEIPTSLPNGSGGYSTATALWSLATNVVRNVSQKQRIVRYVRAEDGTSVIANPAAIIASLMASRWNKHAGVQLYMFNPQYGPIAIECDPIPEDSDYGFAPEVDNGHEPGGVSAIAPNMGRFQTNSAASLSANQRRGYQDTQYSAHLWRWAVRAFSFQQAKMRNGRPVVQGGDPVRFDDSIKLRWPLAAFAQLVVTFAGSGDIKAFDNLIAIKGSCKEIEASTVAPSTVDGLIFVPARLLKQPLKTNDGNITGPRRTNESYVETALKADYEPTSGGASSRNNSNRRPRRSNGKRSPSRPSKPTGMRTVAEKNVTSDRHPFSKEDDPKSRSFKAATDGPFDSSTSEVDESSNAKMKKPPVQSQML